MNEQAPTHRVRVFKNDGFWMTRCHNTECPYAYRMFPTHEDALTMAVVHAQRMWRGTLAI